MLDGFKKVAEGLTEIIEPLNPMVTNMTEKNKEIATGLLQSGFSVKQIQEFVDVSRTQLDEFIEVEDKVLKRLEESKKTKV